jgi:hypothetical protein
VWQPVDPSLILGKGEKLKWIIFDKVNIFILKRSDSVRSWRARQSRTKKYKFDATSSTLNSSTTLSITPNSTISRGSSKRPSLQVELEEMGEETRRGEAEAEAEGEGEGEPKKRISSEYSSDEVSFDESPEGTPRKNSREYDDDDNCSGIFFYKAFT